LDSDSARPAVRAFARIAESGAIFFFARIRQLIGFKFCGASSRLPATRRTKFWSWHRFGAEALVRQGLWEAAIAFAEAARSTTNPGFNEMSINRFCEKLLIEHGRSDEAYRRYGLRAASGTTNLAVYRSLVRAYPDRDRRRMLLDLIEARGDKGKWFAAAKESRFFDIAIECAAAQGADPSTLVPSSPRFLRQGAEIRRHRRAACSLDPSRWQRL